MWRYRSEVSSSSTPNLDFYQNKIPSVPNGDKIEDIHSKWWGNYGLLEGHHGFIQWLFPNSEDPGVNCYASCLSKKEAQIISSDPELKERVRKSFHLMLDFWGMKVDDKTLEFSRTKNFKSRYNNWMGGHNNLRITRTLKSLGELGLPQYKKPWILFLMQEILNGEIRGCSSSLSQFWIPTLPSQDKKELVKIWKEKTNDQRKQMPVKWHHSKTCIAKANGEDVDDESDDEPVSMQPIVQNGDGHDEEYNEDNDSDDDSSDENDDSDEEDEQQNNFTTISTNTTITVTDKFPFTPLLPKETPFDGKDNNDDSSDSDCENINNDDNQNIDDNEKQC